MNFACGCPAPPELIVAPDAEHYLKNIACPAHAFKTAFMLIGQVPARCGYGEEPGRVLGWESPCGRRIADLAGLTRLGYEAVFEPVNLLKEWPGRNGTKGDRQARAAARAMLHRLVGRGVIMLGFNVAAAFGLSLTELVWENWRPVLLPDEDAERRLADRPRQCRVACVPHPSRVDKDAERRAAAFLSAAVQRTWDLPREYLLPNKEVMR